MHADMALLIVAVVLADSAANLRPAPVVRAPDVRAVFAIVFALLVLMFYGKGVVLRRKPGE
jgi:hypothetical protein